MAYSLQEAKELVVKAGLKLVESGLVARTWGNISARVSDTQFVVTPKGRAYDTLTPKDIVLLNIADCSYEGEIKPSSEKGIHAAVYRYRKDVHFVIHTHQMNASVYSVLGQGIVVTGDNVKLLGSFVPNAPYGISSTKKLARNAAMSIKDNPDSIAFLLRSHGAFCLGASMEEAFERSFALETLAEDEILKRLAIPSLEEIEKMYLQKHVINNVGEPILLGNSLRHDDQFVLINHGKVETYSLANPSLQGVAKTHQDIYLAYDVNCIIHDTNPAVMAISQVVTSLRPYIDDVAQIIGVNLQNAKPNEIVRKLKGRNAVLIQGSGALCVGKDDDDAKAVSMILDKQAKSAMLASLLGLGKPLSRIDAWLQRLVYSLKYSKLKQKEK